MAWQDEQPQWGKNKRPAGPEDLIVAFLKKIKEMFDGIGGGQGSGQGGDKNGGGGSGSGSTGMPPGMWGGLGKIALIIGVLFVVNIVYSSFYTIQPGERGVVLRLGKYNKTASPGLNFMVPMIDQVVKVDIETVRKEEFGYRTKVPGQKTIYDKRGYDMESLMLTGDKNVIDVEWIVQYKVNDPARFIFMVHSVPQAVRDVSEAAMRRVVGNRDFDYALSNRDVIEASTERELQAALDDYESGVEIVTVKLQDVNPPDAVKPAFNEVNEADQDMKRLVNEAESTYNRIIPRARGEAKKIYEESEGYAVERVNLAKGETSRFLALLEEYSRAKDVTRKRLYLETMQDVLPSVSQMYVIDKDQRGILPLLNLTGSNVAGRK
ncbi:MAG: FtsH protease activity modulator HflK [Desulfobulbaceae bacterium]|nr:FtsH protease activity modulator HflK [Desulfobulbaceae bacterium]